jgi:hypothetical protein
MIASLLYPSSNPFKMRVPDLPKALLSAARGRDRLFHFYPCDLVGRAES